MLKFKIEVLTSAALAFTLALPAHAAKQPASDGMSIKLVSARKYHGKALPKKQAEKKIKPYKAKPQVLTVRGANIPLTVAASAKKPVVPSQNMEKIAIPEKTAPVKPVVMVAKNDASKPSKRIPVDRPVRESAPAPQVVEKDLVDTLDRMPVETKSATTQPAPMLSTKIATPTASAPAFKPIVQMKNRLTTGRKYELEVIGGKNYSRKHELVLGGKHSSGFGAAVTGSVSVSDYDDSTKNKQTTNDITTILYHPTLYKNDGWDVYGFARIYYPTSDASKAANSWHYLYLLGTNFDLGGGLRLENCLIPHYFSKNSFADDDTYFLLEEELLAKYDVTKWMTVGLGPYMVVDSKERSAPGTSIELTPVIGFNLGDHVYFEPKMYLPIYTDGQVGGGPRRAALSEIAGEFYLKLAM